MRSSKLGLLFFLVFFGYSLAVELKLLINDQSVNPLDILIPTVHSENELCRNHSLLYKEELSKFTVWATDMFDSSTKFPSGIFFGSIYDTGNFDECIKVHLPQDIGFSGQHCMAHFKLKPLGPIAVKKGNVLEYDLYENIFNITTWQKVVKYAQDGSKQTRNEVYVTLCIPSSCSYKDLEKSLKQNLEVIKDLLPFTLEVNVDKRNCQVEREFDFTRADLIFMGVVGAFILFGLFATLYHLFTKLDGLEHLKFPGKADDILRAFSYSHTIKKMASEHKNDDGMDCMHGMKTLSMFLIILGHRIMFSISSPVSNSVYVESLYRKPEYSMLLNGPIVVDTFFAISGFLACYLILQDIHKRKRMVNIFLLYLHRYIRLTPAYLVVLGFYCTIFVQMGDGPFWEERVGIEQERCIETWWTNILYLNNYIMKEKMCMFQSWYLTCDTHYFLIVPFIVYYLWKKPNFGIFLCSGLIFASIIIHFVVIYLNKQDPFLLLYMTLLRDPVTNPTFQLLYIPSHMRLSAYFVGVLGGYIKFKLKTTGYRLPTKVIYPTWIIGFLVVLAIFLIGFLFYLPTDNKDYILSGVFGSLHHFFWSVCMTILIIFVSEGYGSWFAPYLRWRPWALLGRISYTAFLCHGAIQLYSVAINRVPIYTGMFPLVYYTASDISLAYIAGFCVSLVFESPIIQVEKIILGGAPKPDSNAVEKKNGQWIPNKKKEGFVDIYIPKISTVYNKY